MTTAIQSREALEKVDLWLRMYRQMAAIRQFEAQVNQLHPTRRILYASLFTSDFKLRFRIKRCRYLG